MENMRTRILRQDAEALAASHSEFPLPLERPVPDVPRKSRSTGSTRSEVVRRPPKRSLSTSLCAENSAPSATNAIERFPDVASRIFDDSAEPPGPSTSLAGEQSRNPSLSSRDWTLDGLLKQGRRFRQVPRCSALASPQEISAAIERYEQTGEPLILEGWHQHSGWPKNLFTIDWLLEHAGSQVYQLRNVHDRSDKKLPLSEFITRCREFSDALSPPSSDAELLYGKDAECPSEWREWINGEVIPPELQPGGPNDLFHHLEESERVESLMCYLGIEDTFTPCHKDLCASSGHNLMCYTEKHGSSFWFMTASSDAPATSAYFQDKLHEELDWEEHVATVQEFAKAPFPVYIAEQKLGDLVLVPSRSCHQVVNHGGLTVKTSWSRMTTRGLTTALYHELPVYRRVCRPEQYRVKHVLYRSLIQHTTQLETLLRSPTPIAPRALFLVDYSSSNDTKDTTPVQDSAPLATPPSVPRKPSITRIAGDLRTMIDLFDFVLREEFCQNHISLLHVRPPPYTADGWGGRVASSSSRSGNTSLILQPPVPTRPKRSSDKAEKSQFSRGDPVAGDSCNLSCDFCGADIFQSFFECDICVARRREGLGPTQAPRPGDGLLICGACYVEGRSCACGRMSPIQFRPFPDLLRARNRASDTLCRAARGGDPCIQKLTEKDFLGTNEVLIFEAAYQLFKIRNAAGAEKLAGLRNCRHGEHAVPFLWAISCSCCHNAKCFTHILGLGIHSADALLALQTSHEYWHQRHLEGKEEFARRLPNAQGAEKDGAIIDFRARLVLAAKTYPICRPVNPRYTTTGWYDKDPSAVNKHARSGVHIRNTRQGQGSSTSYVKSTLPTRVTLAPSAPDALAQKYHGAMLQGEDDTSLHRTLTNRMTATVPERSVSIADSELTPCPSTSPPPLEAAPASEPKEKKVCQRRILDCVMIDHKQSRGIKRGPLVHSEASRKKSKLAQNDAIGVQGQAPAQRKDSPQDEEEENLRNDYAAPLVKVLGDAHTDAPIFTHGLSTGDDARGVGRSRGAVPRRHEIPESPSPVSAALSSLTVVSTTGEGPPLKKKRTGHAPAISSSHVVVAYSSLSGPSITKEIAARATVPKPLHQPPVVKNRPSLGHHPASTPARDKVRRRRPPGIPVSEAAKDSAASGPRQVPESENRGGIETAGGEIPPHGAVPGLYDVSSQSEDRASTLEIRECQAALDNVKRRLEKLKSGLVSKIEKLETQLTAREESERKFQLDWETREAKRAVDERKVQEARDAREAREAKRAAEQRKTRDAREGKRAADEQKAREALSRKLQNDFEARIADERKAREAREAKRIAEEQKARDALSQELQTLREGLAREREAREALEKKIGRMQNERDESKKRLHEFQLIANSQLNAKEQQGTAITSSNAPSEVASNFRVVQGASGTNAPSTISVSAEDFFNIVQSVQIMRAQVPPNNPLPPNDNTSWQNGHGDQLQDRRNGGGHHPYPFRGRGRIYGNQSSMGDHAQFSRGNLRGWQNGYGSQAENYGGRQNGQRDQPYYQEPRNVHQQPSSSYYDTGPHPPAFPRHGEAEQLKLNRASLKGNENPPQSSSRHGSDTKDSKSPGDHIQPPTAPRNERSVSVRDGDRDRDRERERHRDRERDRKRARERERDRERQSTESEPSTPRSPRQAGTLDDPSQSSDQSWEDDYDQDDAEGRDRNSPGGSPSTNTPTTSKESSKKADASESVRGPVEEPWQSSTSPDPA